MLTTRLLSQIRELLPKESLTVKRKMFAEAFVLALLISTVAVTLLVNSAKANNIPLVSN